MVMEIYMEVIMADTLGTITVITVVIMAAVIWALAMGFIQDILSAKAKRLMEDRKGQVIFHQAGIVL
jgi:hypothetical protein